MSVVILTDTACSLPAAVIERCRLTVLPLTLVVGGAAMLDGDLPLEEVLDRIDEGVTTSAVAPGLIVDALERNLGSPGVDGALVLTISAAMSATYESARLAAERVDATGAAVRVVDTGTAAGAQGLVAIAAAEAAARGDDLDAVVAVANRVADRVRLIAAVDTLDFLVRSGRVPGIAGWAGRSLGVHPLFEFRRGKVRRLRPAFSEDAALDRIAQACRGSRPREGPARLHVAGMHALALDKATRLLGMVTNGAETQHSFVGSFSTVMVAHTGPGVAGLAWWWDNGGA